MAEDHRTGNDLSGHYLNYESLTKQLEQWAREYPHVVRLQSLATTKEGREVWLLTIGHEPNRHRPAVWVDANMHASELAGTQVCLAIVEDLLRIHSDECPVADLPDHLCEIMREGLFYVVPRMSPDGAEDVLTTGRFVRSRFRSGKHNDGLPYWRPMDVDGDGLSLLMRREDPCGDFVESTEVPGLMLPRQIEDKGPYFRIYPEGMIENFDGETIPDGSPLAHGDIDFNRNFPIQWAPEWEQGGAGDLPLSENETAAIAKFFIDSPHIYAVFNLHTFGGVMIRPPMGVSDKEMDPFDLAVYRQLEAWSEDIVGYPMVSGFEGFSPREGVPVYGSFMAFASSRGAISYVAELWDLFAEIGVPPKKRFVDLYSGLTRDELIALGHWDDNYNQGRAIRQWSSVDHPQLGLVEVGGADPRIGIWNPPPERLPDICAHQSAMLFRVASMVPRLAIQEVHRLKVSEDVTRLRLSVENTGYLPTYGTQQARKVHKRDVLCVKFEAVNCQVLSPAHDAMVIESLEGWGKGLHGECSALYEMYSSRGAHSKGVEVVVQGHGVLRVGVGNERCGWIYRDVEVWPEAGETNCFKIGQSVADNIEERLSCHL